MKKGQKNTAANNTEAMGKKADIAIFSKDALLARTVELLGKLLGYASRTYSSYSGQLCKITVIDLDSFPDEKVTEIIEAGSRVVVTGIRGVKLIVAKIEPSRTAQENS